MTSSDHDSSATGADLPHDREETERDAGPTGGAMDDWMAALRDVAPYLDLGWRLAVSAAAPPLLGHFLVDDWWGTTPWGVLTGAALGAAAAAVQLRRLQVEFDR